jgi:hypothetical protein
MKGKGDKREVGGLSEEEGGESGDDEDDGVGGEASTIMGPEGGSIETGGGVSGKSRKDISSIGYLGRSRRWGDDRKDASHQT